MTYQPHKISPQDTRTTTRPTIAPKLLNIKSSKTILYKGKKTKINRDQVFRKAEEERRKLRGHKRHPRGSRNPAELGGPSRRGEFGQSEARRGDAGRGKARQSGAERGRAWWDLSEVKRFPEHHLLFSNQEKKASVLTVSSKSRTHQTLVNYIRKHDEQLTISGQAFNEKLNTDKKTALRSRRLTCGPTSLLSLHSVRVRHVRINIIEKYYDQLTITKRAVDDRCVHETIDAIRFWMQTSGLSV